MEEIAKNSKKIIIIKLIISFCSIVCIAIALSAEKYILTILLTIYTLIFIVFAVVGFRKISKIFFNNTSVHARSKIVSLIILIMTILILVVPMGISPLHNGEIDEHRNQYELLAEAMTKGNLNLYPEENTSQLDNLNNPYDPIERAEKGVSFHWDHAYFQGKYYVYFGVVPVITLFLPFRLLFGVSLPTWNATQFFTTLFLIGLFVLLKRLKRQYNIFLPIKAFGLYFVTISFISCWFISSAPELYCTAQSSALCFSIWSFCFFMFAIANKQSWKKYLYIFLSSLSGALIIGCRPSMIIVESIIFVIYIKEFLINDKRKLLNTFIYLAPYIIVGISQMFYNYIRFDNLFEFGQSFQLTEADQRHYSSFLTRMFDCSMIYNLLLCFFGFGKQIPLVFPGIFWEYLIFWFVLFLVKRTCRNQIHKSNLKIVILVTLATICAEIVIQLISTPMMLERYKADWLWLLGIIVYLIFFAEWKANKNYRKKIEAVFCYLCFASISACLFLFFVPTTDGNLAYCYFPDWISNIMMCIQ